MADEKNPGRLRWKKHDPERGLRRIGAGPRGSDYTDGVTVYATVYAHSFRHTGKKGWYWTSRFHGSPLVNTCGIEGLSEQEAKAEAQAHVKQVLSNTKESQHAN